MAMFDFLSLGKQIADTGAEIRNRRRSLEQLKRERDLIAVAPLNKEDAIKVLHSRIDAAAIRHMRIFTESLTNLALKGDIDRCDTPILSATKPNIAATPLSLEGGICLAMGDQMKAAASRIVESMAWPDGSMEHAAKQKRLAELDSKIGTMETDLTALVHSARAAGISV